CVYYDYVHYAMDYW
nr:immunoglobulin heavy chain junction region [Mus musculus]